MSTQDPTDRHGRRHVVVTGIGVKTPAGLTVDEFWIALLGGQSQIAPITLFDASAHPVRIAGEVRGFEPEPYLGPKEPRRTDRVSQLAIAAASDAIADAAGVAPDDVAAPDTVLRADAFDCDPARVGVVGGSGIGGIRTLEDQISLYVDRGPTRVSPLLVPMMMPNAPAAHIAIRHGFTGPNLAVATACATGANAIGEAARLVRGDAADVVVAGGAEACVSPVTIAAFAKAGALTRNPDPMTASRPFDVKRDGFVIGEGAAFVVLESFDHATARGATIHGELVGYGATCDAHHITAPLDDGAGAAACMQAALDEAGLAPGEIGHVNAHGTSTPLNDAAEAQAVTKVFGDHAVPVTSTKGVTGHLIGAAGAAEFVATLLAVRDGQVPPTANLQRCELPVDVVAGEPRTIAPEPGLSASFAFGGHNAVLIVSSPPG